MLGHVLWRTCRDAGIDALATVRAERLEGSAASALDPAATLSGVRAEDPGSVARALDESGAEVVVNCIGIVKQADAARDPVAAIRVNSLFPHELAAACAQREVKLVHVSTDCVFSGRRGGYAEDDEPDPADLYGRSKLLGEPAGGALTLRTSMLGRELEGANGLLEWFLSQRGGSVRGFAGAIFSGPTVPVLSRAIADVIARHPGLDGLHHVGADPIDKHSLLWMLRDAFGVEVEIERDESVRVDRSLDAGRFRSATGWTAPSWAEMVAELAESAPERAGREGSLAHR
jgi:dTDP-4-dehydrorhamnose reductase